MAKNTTATGSTIDGVTVVHPDNMSDKSFNFENNKYEVAISKRPNNMLSLREDGLYYGITPTRSAFYVDYLNGSDSNDGSKQAPFKTVGKAISSVEVGTIGTGIFLKEEQKHYFSTGKAGSHWGVNASYFITVYGDKYDAIERKWKSNHLGYSTSEPVTASMEYQAIKPSLVFKNGTTPIDSDSLQRKYLDRIAVYSGTVVRCGGLKFVAETDQDVGGGGWFTSCFIGQGLVQLQACEMVQRQLNTGVNFYLATSTQGSLEVLLNYFLISGTGNLFYVGQYPLRVYSAYDTVTDQTMNNAALPPMNYKGVATASEIFALTNNSNPKSFITNK